MLFQNNDVGVEPFGPVETNRSRPRRWESRMRCTRPAPARAAAAAAAGEWPCRAAIGAARPDRARRKRPFIPTHCVPSVDGVQTQIIRHSEVAPTRRFRTIGHRLACTAPFRRGRDGTDGARPAIPSPRLNEGKLFNIEVNKSVVRARAGSAARGLGDSGGATEPSDAGEVAGAHQPAADTYMYVCGEGAPGPRFECFEAGAGSGVGAMEHFEDHMFQEFGKERHVQVVVGAGGELQYRDELPAYGEAHPHTPPKRKDEPILLQSVESAPASVPPPPPPPAPSKKSDKKKNDNNGIKKKKTRYQHLV
ncbi:hypothetical protein EVAR_11939_1 [Eumeta japonica]|uniref:Uncharacterized protein n=1 Tax=Eumeta variegata TaxID=151549 RepID=A0A4C1U4U6_EUMVA|nr:hypothetical protein EVAR_11939_1 [Eumeta japonica]